MEFNTFYSSYYNNNDYETSCAPLISAVILKIELIGSIIIYGNVKNFFCRSLLQYFNFW
jgi:hypothetical protein